MSCNQPLLALIVIAGTLMGCATTTGKGSWGGGAHWPNGEALKKAAQRAAKSPHTWAPLAAAALLSIGDADDSLSSWAAREQPVFGDKAADASDTLLALSKWTYVATGLVTPSDSVGDRAKGFAVGVSATVATLSITRGLKSLTGRERPNGRDDKSFPSGHSSTSSSWATLTAQNIEYIAMADWARTGLTVAVYGVAAGTAWARVEAEEHHITDVLVGYALGHFVAAFMHEAFLEAGTTGPVVSYTAIDGGGTLTLRMPLGRSQDASVLKRSR